MTIEERVAILEMQLEKTLKLLAGLTSVCDSMATAIKILSGK